MQDQLKIPTHPNDEGVWQLGLCPWWLGGRSEALRHSSCESGVATRGPDACVWTSPATVPAAEEYAGDPVVLRHQCRECTGLPVCVSFEETVEDDQQTARRGKKRLFARRVFFFLRSWMFVRCRVFFPWITDVCLVLGIFFFLRSWMFVRCRVFFLRSRIFVWCRVFFFFF